MKKLLGLVVISAALTFTVSVYAEEDVSNARFAELLDCKYHANQMEKAFHMKSSGVSKTDVKKKLKPQIVRYDNTNKQLKSFLESGVDFLYSDDSDDLSAKSFKNNVLNGCKSAKDLTVSIHQMKSQAAK